MQIDLQKLTDKEKNDYRSLAKALNIQTEELLSLDFYNENMYDEGGNVEKIKYVFSNDAPSTLLRKIKGLDGNNTVILFISELNYSF
ncbi:MAG TPA: hypothetical protein VM888_09380 [Chitinophagaceae bacterium]|nr:hypothetical protein [Chitinophagaceae bacterium]